MVPDGAGLSHRTELLSVTVIELVKGLLSGQDWAVDEVMVSVRSRSSV